ncbi:MULTISPECIES: ankyrin repeat domain-containing protein [Chryseobacterium]|uniref:Ankyrin repeat protein n=1 Tax=Chryseobacterium camelliae TaxID=1265445 RepID=A0ABU0TL65_9FLAO|nr:MULTISPECIES: ankyrin repeat domain-containing protein [Chryseobacterium]MDT3408382.1 ankyrin repeat protein [Pseudacidovorax intermedius]MDQ1097761.1 ankyrin repeat protein [Chryseobacterium camelliae]MDQ1101695.1 ankyrin repeat protein [Chryseobacterium sp. SORGH_AS_1048]MDR6085133.1 ankyrin repeat protein [Chryseobacterium sp. SORGH_AS_0909]MDR6129491.1 ankyrin repeat protein [Chryseobacterium sp. SORGH_AS_1175]
MKNLLFIAFFMLSKLFYAQELNNDQIQILKFDNTARFADLLDGQNINQCFNVNETSYNLLALAIKMKSVNIFQKLIDEKADLEKICDGKSPLMFAAKYGDLKMVKKLLESGAKKETKNNKGLTALDYAKKYNQPELIKLLE